MTNLSREFHAQKLRLNPGRTCTSEIDLGWHSDDDYEPHFSPCFIGLVMIGILFGTMFGTVGLFVAGTAGLVIGKLFGTIVGAAIQFGHS